jgi:peptidoglycan/LPS O-acetylase OafA/YrhL
MASTATPSREVNWELLALTRFVLAWIVVSVHTYMPSQIAGLFGALGGKAAVVGFMLISGFSIAASIEARPQEFILRRILRIYPMYFGALLLTLLVQALIGPHVEVAGTVIEASGWGRIIGNLLLTQMYLCKALEFNGPFWSLSIEFSYYLLAPLLLLLPRALLFALAIVSGVVFTLPPDPDASRYYDLLTRFNGLRYLWSWLIGFCLFYNRSKAIALAGLILCLVVFPLSGRDYSGLPTLLTILGTYAVLQFSNKIRLNEFCKRTFTFLGDLSYPLYLVHFPLGLLLVVGLGVRSDLMFFALAMGLAYLNILLFDGFLKRRLFKPIFTSLYRLGVRFCNRAPAMR